ncbi:MAG: hypothetical protein OXD38_05700, partial [Aestuariivita sp.]|nr:hypothetical protein [Aestuariivita sp.]
MFSCFYSSLYKAVVFSEQPDNADLRWGCISETSINFGLGLALPADNPINHEACRDAGTTLPRSAIPKPADAASAGLLSNTGHPGGWESKHETSADRAGPGVPRWLRRGDAGGCAGGCGAGCRGVAGAGGGRGQDG